MPRDHYPTAGDLRLTLQAAGLTVSEALEGQLWSMAPAGVTAFERQVKRRMLAPATPVAQLLSPPQNHAGLLVLDDLASVDEAGLALTPTVTYTPLGSPATTWVLGTDYELQPYNAAQRTRPYDRIILRRNVFLSPLGWTQHQSLSITGRWGYGCLLPDDAWQAMRNLALLEAFEVSVYGLRGGLVKWTQQGVTEEFASKLGAVWQGAIDRAVRAYRRYSV